MTSLNELKYYILARAIFSLSVISLSQSPLNYHGFELKKCYTTNSSTRTLENLHTEKWLPIHITS